MLYTRLLSVTAWYGHAFVVLSLAMVGLTRGSLVAMRARADNEPLRPWIAQRLFSLAAWLVVSTAVILTVPLQVAADLTSFASILVVAAAATAPMVAGGSIVARLMAESEVAIPWLYAIDLVAAAAGALAPLVLLGPLSAPAALALLAALAAVTAAIVAPRAGRGRSALLAVGALAVVLLTRFTHVGLELQYTKGAPRPPRELIGFEAWNPLSHVTMTVATNQLFPLWGPSPTYRPPMQPVANAYIDGEAGTPVYGFRTLDHLQALRFDVTNAVHALRPDGIACVIGIGGGRDLESALVFGHDTVLGAEINPAMVQMLRGASSFSPVLQDPRVQIEIGDGRSVLARHSNVHCRTLQASLVDTWAATGAGAFAHTESTLYTREAWGLFLRRTEPDGIVTFSRWYDPTNVSETSRLASLATAALIDRGVETPARHLALLASGRVATVLVSPAPFSDADLEALHTLRDTMQFQMLLAPDQRPASPILARIIAARDIAALDRAGLDEGLDTSPSSDDQPFFFQLLAPRAWLHPIATIRRANRSTGVLSGNTVALLELLMTFVAVTLLGVALLGPTVARTLRTHRDALPGARAAVYFGALGAGFMMAEVALVQRMHVVLGHPTYALVVVLAGLLVATGIGSALSSRITSRRAVTIAALVLGVVLAALPYAVIRPLARATADASLAVRIAWTFGAAALVGVIAGTLFPSGLKFLTRQDGAPLALAINGVTSVLGSVLAILISVWAGIPASFVVAGVIYAIAAWAGPRGWEG